MTYARKSGKNNEKRSRACVYEKKVVTLRPNCKNANYEYIRKSDYMDVGNSRFGVVVVHFL
jgi:hypothetical protein